METFGVGIIGCGWVAGEYVKAFYTDQRSEIRGLGSSRMEAFVFMLARTVTYDS